MNDERAWEQLLEALNAWAEAREVPGGMEVTFRASTGALRTVEIVLTPEDWVELAVVIGGQSPETVRRTVLSLPEEESFLVCDSGVELVPSTTRELPPDPFDDVAPEPGGHWVVLDDAGNVVSRFVDWTDEEERPAP